MMKRCHEIEDRKANGGDEGGFTLIELLIVIVVMGILAAVVVFALGGVTGRSAVSSCKSDGRTVETAVAAFQVNNPGTTPTAALLTSTATTYGGPYLKSFPANSAHYYIGIAQAALATTGEVDIALGNTSGIAPTTAASWQAFDSEAGSGTTVAAGCNAVS